MKKYEEGMKNANMLRSIAKANVKKQQYWEREDKTKKKEGKTEKK